MSFLDPAHRLTHGLEEALDAVRHRLKAHSGSYGPVEIVPYLGHGSGDAAIVRGRVLEERPALLPRPDDSPLRNLLAAWRRFDSAELPDVAVLARAGDARAAARTDGEGFFRIEVAPLDVPVEDGWATVRVDVPGEPDRGIGPADTLVRVRVPSLDADYGVISDVDDTVLRTDATSLLAAARLTLLENAHTRMPFRGVAALYRAFEGGREGGGHNPVFYVSSSPWNLYDLLVDFLAQRRIPLGPVFLRDVGLSASGWIGAHHRDHKLARIREILESHPLLPFVLLGDSGQQDPEIYAEVVREHPGRILAVYVRDVTGDVRDRQVFQLADRVRARDVEMLLVPDSLAAAEHAVAQGLIPSAALDPVRRDVERDADAPDAAEREALERAREEVAAEAGGQPSA